jgi:Zn-dependent protease
VSIFQRFQDDPAHALLWALALFISVVLHEYGHAWAAIYMGDPTPMHNGRFVWNPLKYLDPFGILMFLLVGFGGLGYVMTRPDLYRNRVFGEVLVSSAGIIMNLVLVVISAVTLRLLIDPKVLGLLEPLLSSGRSEMIVGLGLFGTKAPGWLIMFLYELFSLNVILAMFNALPIPPLDGSRLLAAIVPGPLGDSMRLHLNTPGSSLLLLIAIVVLNEPIGRLLREAVQVAARLLF